MFFGHKFGFTFKLVQKIVHILLRTGTRECEIQLVLMGTERPSNESRESWIVSVTFKCGADKPGFIKFSPYPKVLYATK